MNTPTANRAEGPQCWLKVLTDGAWMQLGYRDAITADHKSGLIAAAESILEAHQWQASLPLAVLE